MSAYVVFQGEINDAEQYDQYKPLAAESVEKHVGSYLITVSYTHLALPTILRV